MSADVLRAEGINCKGYGVIPKFVMQDQQLSVEAKGIYAYLCSYAGNGIFAFPSRNLMLSELGMCKDAFYNHYNALIKEGYITVIRDSSKGITGHNIYTLVPNPKKFEEWRAGKTYNSAKGDVSCTVMKDAGYGFIPKSVMTISQLPITAKAIYALLCCFADKSNRAFPSVDQIVSNLHITKNTYYKYLGMLKERDLLTCVQRRENGKMSINDFYLNEFPGAEREDAASRDLGARKEENKELIHVAPSNKIPDTVKPHVEAAIAHMPNTKMQDNNINSTILNIYIYQSEKGMDRYIYTFENDIPLPKQEIPNDQQPNKLSALIAESRDKEKYQNGYQKNKEDNQVAFQYNSDRLFYNALTEMVETRIPIRLIGKDVTELMVCNRLNEYIEISEDGKEEINLKALKETVSQDFEKACSEKNILNHLKYMQACIWTALQEGEIGYYAAYRNKGKKKELGDPMSLTKKVLKKRFAAQEKENEMCASNG